MKYYFDKVINRHGTNSLKYDFLAENGFSGDTIPMWVADMDFAAPNEVVEAAVKTARHGIYGYCEAGSGYVSAVQSWFLKRHGIDLQEQWLIQTPGVVFALAAAIRAFSNAGDGILIQQPVYYMFETLIKRLGRKVVNNPLVNSGGAYSIDFDDFERKAKQAKVFLLCSPHNPVGRVWHEGELLRMLEICRRHNVVVVADEIHADLTLFGAKHISTAALGKELLNNLVLCTAPSKTFNIAGLQAANIFVPDKALRTAFRGALLETGYFDLNPFAIAACEAAYTHGEDWLNQLITYLEQNVLFLQSFLEKSLTAVSFTPPQATYLMWLDCSALGLDDAALFELVKNKARLWPDAGTLFGKEGSGFLRFNIACPKETLSTALERFAFALKNH